VYTKVLDKSISGAYESESIAEVGAYAFYNCENLVSVSVPNATAIGEKAFDGCFRMTTADVSGATTVGSYALNACRGLVELNFPVLESIGNAALRGCIKLETVVFGKTLNLNGVFANMQALTALVLRGDSKYGAGAALNLGGSPIANGTGYIYVPAALVDSYKTDSNWGTYANQIRALEEYTVDGTITGALDETKI
jgi:hypothetical protein